MSSLFDGLYIARSGVRASRAALNVTGQNISNANTEGYTRQRVDQSSLPPAESGGQWASLGSAVGCGVNVDSIEQLRDAFLDFEFRSLNAKSGESSTQVNTLYDMEDIFTTTTTADSASKSSVIDILNNEFQNMLSELQSLTVNNSNVSESDVRDSISSLATKLNIAAKALETTRDQQFTNLSKYGVDDANTKLKNIASFNKQIKDAEMSGNSVLELEDKRNLLLDQLSKEVPISVQKTPTLLANGKTVDTMSVYLADQDGNILTYKDASGATQKYTLLDHDSYAQFGITPAGSISANDTVKISLSAVSQNGHVNNFQYDASNVAATNTTVSGYLSTIATSKDADVRENAFENLKSVLSCGGSSSLTLTDNGTNVTVTLADSGGHSYTLVNGSVGAAAVGSAVQTGSNLDVTPTGGGALVHLSAADATLTGDVNSSLKSGTFSGYLKLLNESGEYDTAAGQATTTFRGIGYYQKYLDTLAQNLASTMNTLNYNAAKKDSLGAAVPAEKQLLLSGSTETPASGHTGADAIADITKGITAKNIHVAAAWANDGVLTTTKDVSPSKDNNSASFSNILDMIGKLTTDKPTLITPAGIMVFTGSVQAAFANVSNTLARGANSLQDTDNANSNKVNNIDSSRQQLSSVSLDDEAVSIVQYSQSLNASSRFMTAVDECLQTVINNMGMAGRG